MTLNERIAKVKGYQLSESGGPGYRDPIDCDWSGSIADAWELVEEIEPRHAVCLEGPLYQYDGWRCSFLPNASEDDGYKADARTAPEAICLAYLAVMEGEDA